MRIINNGQETEITFGIVIDECASKVTKGAFGVGAEGINRKFFNPNPMPKPKPKPSK
jgi:hypothetical protein